jgi:hypothetical protein
MKKLLTKTARAVTTRGIIAGSAALGSLACGAHDEDTGVGNDAVSRTGEALVGTATADASCVAEGRDDEVAKLAWYGRVISRSTAFGECIRRVISQETELTLTNAGNPYGPYVPCGSGSTETDEGHVCSSECPNPPAGSDCRCDPIMTASQAEQRARILSTAASRRPIVQSCDSGLGSGAGATSQGFTGDAEAWRWTSLTNGSTLDVSYAAGVAWHEAAHSHGYSHGSNTSEQQPDNCGFGYDNQSAWSSRQAGTAMVGACIIEVGKRSLDATYGNCGLESSSCDAGELRVIRSFDSGPGDCECVPDTFESPSNANEINDFFGWSMAAGDFDNDGDDDLAVSAPGEDSSAGAVYLYRGSVVGLQPWKRITQSDLNVDDAALGSSVNLAHEAGDKFGVSLAAGDFNNDGYDDLAIGLPGEKLGYASCSAGSCGYAVVLPGTATGLKLATTSTSPNPTGLTQASLGANESNDAFGWSLAAGDLSGDGLADLAVGVPFETLGTVTSGVVMLFRGQASQSRLVTPWTYLSQESGNLGTNESGDEFGAALAIGNLFGSDSRKELAIGAPGEKWNQQPGEGMVFIADYNGTAWSIPAASANLSNSGVSRFGAALAIGDVIQDSTEDLVVGAPEQSNGVGGVLVFRGLQNTMTYAQFIHNGDSVAGDRFGASLSIGDFKAGGKKDLAVGIPGETLDTDDEGAIWVYSGGTSALTSSAIKSQGNFYGVSATDSILPTETLEPLFGWSLASGNFNGGGGNELVVGSPVDDPAQDGTDAGAIFLFRAHTLADAQKIDQVTTRFGSGHFD